MKNSLKIFSDPSGRMSQKEPSLYLGSRSKHSRELELLKYELAEFDEKTKDLLGLPLSLKQWRRRKVKAIEREQTKIIHEYFEVNKRV